MNFKDGVYFDMPEDVYHSIERLSNSGIKKLLMSVSDFWESSWMNPEKATRDDDTMAKLWGRAYHCRLGEGMNALMERYYFDLDPASFGDAKIYRTVEDMKSDLAPLGITGMSKFKKSDCVNCLLQHYPQAIVWDREVEAHEQANAGKQKIPAHWVARLERAAAFIEHDPHIAPLFKRGVSEVTVLWTKEVEDDDGSGRRYKVPCKARLDRLQFLAMVKSTVDDAPTDVLMCSDLKNFANAQGRRVPLAVISQAAGDKHALQAAMYYEAMDEFKKALAEKRSWFWVPDDAGDVGLVGGAPDEFATIAKADPRMVFVYQKSSGAPVALARGMPRFLTIVEVARRDIELSAIKFAKCMAVFGTDIWIIPEKFEVFDDESFPQYAVE